MKEVMEKVESPHGPTKLTHQIVLDGTGIQKLNTEAAQNFAVSLYQELPEIREYYDSAKLVSTSLIWRRFTY